MAKKVSYQHIDCLVRKRRIQDLNALDGVADVLDRDRRVPAVSHMVPRFFCCFSNHTCKQAFDSILSIGPYNAKLERFISTSLATTLSLLT